LKTSLQGLKNVRKVNKSVWMGKSAIQIKFVGDFDAIVEQADGTKKRASIKDIQVAPDAGCNLLSLTKLLRQGYKLYGDNEGLEPQKAAFLSSSTKLWMLVVDTCLEFNSSLTLQTR